MQDRMEPTKGYLGSRQAHLNGNGLAGAFPNFPTRK